MKTIFLFFLLPFFTCVTINAQFKTIAESPVFEEPERGSVKIVQLPNGNTVFIYFSIQRHFEVHYSIYSPAHRVIKQNEFELNNPNMQMRVSDPVVVNNDIVLPIDAFFKYNWVSLRMVIDGEKGVVKAMEDYPDIIKPLPGIEKGHGLLDKDNMDGKIVETPDRKIYSIFLIGSDKTTGGKSIIISSFDSSHKKVNEKNFPIPDAGFQGKYLSNITYIGKNKIFKWRHGIISIGF
jgi:hypothetical protein